MAQYSRKQWSLWQKNYRHRLRTMILMWYGGRCECCGENRDEFLCIDHINGGGNKHRNEISGGKKMASYKFYLWLKRNNFPEGFRILCANCNAAVVKGLCPHQFSV